MPYAIRVSQNPTLTQGLTTQQAAAHRALRPLDGGVGGASMDDPSAGLAPSPLLWHVLGLGLPAPPAAASAAGAAAAASFSSASAAGNPDPSPAGAEEPGTNAASAPGAPSARAGAPGGRSTPSSESAGKQARVLG